MTATFNAKINTVVDNGKVNTVLMTGVNVLMTGVNVPANSASSAVQNNINLVINDPALLGQFKPGKNYTVTVTEV